MQVKKQRLYLNIPFADRTSAKKLGARWDCHAKRWYAPAKVDPAPLLARWPKFIEDLKPTVFVAHPSDEPEYHATRRTERVVPDDYRQRLAAARAQVMARKRAEQQRLMAGRCGPSEAGMVRASVKPHTAGSETDGLYSPSPKWNPAPSEPDDELAALETDPDADTDLGDE